MEQLRKLLLLALLGVGSNTALASTRVVSMNVCADQLLLELADAEQIVALSELSRHADASFHHVRAEQFPNTLPTAEQVLALQPSLVIASNFGQQHTIALLRQQGIRVEEMPIAQTLDEVFLNIRQLSLWLDQSKKGDALVAILKRRIESLANPVPPKPLAAIFDANGYTVGKHSLRGQMLELAGFDNMANTLGIQSYGKISLESLLVNTPAAIVDSPYATGTWSRAQALPLHPALRRSKFAPKVISLAVNSTICAGPWTIDNIEILTNQRIKMQNSAL